MATADRMLRVLNVFAFHFVAATTRRRNQTIDDVKQPPQKRYTKQTPGGMFIDPPVPVCIISTSLGWKDARTGCVCVYVLRRMRSGVSLRDGRCEQASARASSRARPSVSSKNPKKNKKKSRVARV